MIYFLFTLTLAHAIKDGLDEIETRLKCSGALSEAYYREDVDMHLVKVRRAGDRFCDYVRTDRDFHDGQGYVPLIEIYGREYVNEARLRDKRVLDAGCGGGKFVDYLRGLGARARGIDLALTESQRRRPNDFVEADMLTMDFAPGSFDYVFTNFSTFYYEPLDFELLNGILQKFARVFKPGGRALIGGSPARKLKTGEPHESYLSHGYRNMNDYLKRLLAGTGFEIESAGYDRVVLRKSSRFETL